MLRRGLLLLSLVLRVDLPWLEGLKLVRGGLPLLSLVLRMDLPRPEVLKLVPVPVPSMRRDLSLLPLVLRKDLPRKEWLVLALLLVVLLLPVLHLEGLTPPPALGSEGR